MVRFDKGNTKELKEFLYTSCVHDAQMESVRYKCEEHILEIKLLNPIFNKEIDFAFCDVETVLSITSNERKDNRAIISITAEENFSYLHNYIPTYSKCIEDSIYLLIQFFSGNELHIVSKSVVINIAKRKEYSNDI